MMLMKNAGIWMV